MLSKGEPLSAWNPPPITVGHRVLTPNHFGPSCKREINFYYVYTITHFRIITALSPHMISNMSYGSIIKRQSSFLKDKKFKQLGQKNIPQWSIST